MEVKFKTKEPKEKVITNVMYGIGILNFLLGSKDAEKDLDTLKKVYHKTIHTIEYKRKFRDLPSESYRDLDSKVEKTCSEWLNTLEDKEGISIDEFNCNLRKSEDTYIFRCEAPPNINQKFIDKYYARFLNSKIKMLNGEVLEWRATN